MVLLNKWNLFNKNNGSLLDSGKKGGKNKKVTFAGQVDKNGKPIEFDSLLENDDDIDMVDEKDIYEQDDDDDDIDDKGEF